MFVNASWSEFLRCPKKLSTSSMNMIAGCSLYAKLNTAETAKIEEDIIVIMVTAIRMVDIIVSQST